MGRPRRFHDGTKLAIQTQRKCLQGLLMLGAFCFASGLVQNTLTLHEQHVRVAREVVVKEVRLEQLREQHQDLLGRKAFLQSNTGVVAVSRRLGYGRPDERRVMFDPYASSAPGSELE